MPARVAWAPPYELELLPVGADRNSGWKLGGDHATVDKARTALIEILERSTGYQEARVRQYWGVNKTKGRAVAHCFLTWIIHGTKVVRQENGAIWE